MTTSPFFLNIFVYASRKDKKKLTLADDVDTPPTSCYSEASPYRFPFADALSDVFNRLGIDPVAQLQVQPSEGVFLAWYTRGWSVKGTFHMRLKIPEPEALLRDIAMHRSVVDLKWEASHSDV